MTAADLSRLPDSAFAGPPYRDQFLIVKAVAGVRMARSRLHDGNVTAFLFAVSVASFTLGQTGYASPSWKRVSDVLSRLLVAAADVMTIAADVTVRT